MKIVSTLLIEDEKKWLGLALSCKRARDTSLSNLKENILEAYNKYVTVVNSIELDLPDSLFAIEVNKALKIPYTDLYNKPTTKLKNLLIFKRREHTLTSCPYCGNPTIPDTLDHFIPKDLLAEYSIFPNNLVPQCRTCAPIKSNKYFADKENIVMFAHPFYSKLLDDVVIEIISDIVDNEVVFQVKFSTRSENEKDKLAIKLHIQSLKIKERIISYCYKETKKWIRKLKKNRFDIESVLTARLSGHDIHEERSNWEFLLYKSLLQSEPVLRYLKAFDTEEQHTVIETRELIELDI